MSTECPVCSATEPETIDRLLVFGYGPRFVEARWGIPRRRIKKHLDECLVGKRRAAAEDELRSFAMAAKEGVAR
jgi:hypothetical protein